MGLFGRISGIMNKSVFNTAQFHACVDSADKLEDARAEIAFVGRSNVGKSSLVNALCGCRLLAKTSKTPGKTRFSCIIKG